MEFPRRFKFVAHTTVVAERYTEIIFTDRDKKYDKQRVIQFYWKDTL